MSRIIPSRPEGGESIERRQFVRLPTSLYGGMFAWYSPPKEFPKYNKPDETDTKFFVGFVVTHDRAYRPLAHFSEASVGIRPKLYYDEGTGLKSTYLLFLHALFGGKKTYQQVLDLSDEEIPDLNDMIGRPATIFTEVAQKPDKNGIFANRIKSIEPIDFGLWAAVRDLYAARKIDSSGERARLAYPAGVYEDSTVVVPESAGLGSDESPFDEDVEVLLR